MARSDRPRHPPAVAPSRDPPAGDRRDHRLRRNRRLLSGTAAILLFVAAGQLVAMVRDPGQNTGIEVLDTLLLLFIIVELLFAVRATLSKRELVAEPFLLVGIIASIKEIVVLSVKAAENIGAGAGFRDQLGRDRRARRRGPGCSA